MDKLIFLWWYFPGSAPIQSHNHSRKNLTGWLPSGRESNAWLLQIKLSVLITLSSTYIHIYTNIPPLTVLRLSLRPSPSLRVTQENLLTCLPDRQIKHVWLTARQLSIKVGWWDTPLTLRDLAEWICLTKPRTQNMRFQPAINNTFCLTTPSPIHPQLKYSKL